MWVVLLQRSVAVLSGARKVSKIYPKKCNVYQEQFHRHFNFEGHNGMEDSKITEGGLKVS